jgi:hypothetical protein
MTKGYRCVGGRVLVTALALCVALPAFVQPAKRTDVIYAQAVTVRIAALKDLNPPALSRGF